MMRALGAPAWRVSVAGLMCWAAVAGAAEDDTARRSAPAHQRAPSYLGLEIESALSQYPPDQKPFGLRPAPAREASGGGTPTALFLGAFSALLVIAVASGLLRRKRARTRRRETARGERAARHREWLRSELARARSALREDPRRASNIAAAVLRGHAALRFSMPILAATTDELAAAEPPPGEHAGWSNFLRILGKYDVERFRPHDSAGSNGGDPSAERVAICLDETERFMRESAARGAEQC